MAAPAGGKRFRPVTEPARERETLQYGAYLLTTTTINSSGKPAPAADKQTSLDSNLTAFAQLGVYKTGTPRSLISLFDSSYQYIVAEATADISLAPSLGQKEHGADLWLCNTAIPRVHAVCDYTVCGKGPFGNAEAGCREDELPLTKVDNLETTPPFSTKAYCLPGKPARFYAAVPIRTKRGINIGVYCVLHSEPVPEWGHQQTRSLREISRLIMSHLEAKRDRGSHRRAERMARGMGSFLDHKTTLSGWKGGSFPAAYVNQPELEGDLNARQQASPSQSTNLTQDEHESSGQTLLDQMQSRRTDSSKGQPRSAHGSSHGGRQRASTPINIKTLPPPKTFRNGLGDDDDDKSVQHIFSKAANILRESIETEGCLFVDPSSTTFGSFSQEPKAAGATEPSSSSTSSGEDTSGQPDGGTPSLAHCPVLGFSTSTHHSINDDSDVGFRDKVAQNFVATLIRRYPKGHVFNFDAYGEPLLSDSSEEKSLSGSDGSPPGPTPSPLQNQKPRRPNPWARERDGSNLLEIFPGARSVAFMPMWDSKRERWHAAGFVYTYQFSRWFTDDGELSFFKAFSMLITEGLLRHETLLAAKAKSDALSCISHELRSPLHGILLGVELLNDTSLSVFQGDVSHTIETCCRTLIDTVDHLLDYSKINNFDSNRSQQVSAPPRTRGLSGSISRTLEAGMMSLKSTINLSLLAEEVVESVFAGFYFQQMSVRQMSNKTGQFADSAGNSKLDTMRAMDDLGSVDQSGPQGLTAKVGDVYVFLMIDPNCCWTFYAEGGALRRIIMNIFGNSLKYTHRGAIRVSITQASTRKDSTKGPNRVIITVSDTGIGMSQDFLDNHLFEPFSQENSISPGTGLGLSIVKKIVSQQRGRISVKSHLGVGTSVIVTLPLRPQGGPAADGNKALNQALASFNADVHELRNLRVRLVGFQSSTLATRDAVDVEGQTFDSLSLLQNVCADWLKLDVISEADKETIMPDLVILSEETHINQTNEKDLISIPTVVVCRNALVAYQYTNAYRLENRYDQFDRVLEFISQPIGPHKLAKILLLVFSRWQSIRDGSSDGLLSHGIGTPPSENEPAQPFTPPLLSAVSNRRDAKDTAPPEETQIVEPSDSGPPTTTSLPRRPGVSRTSSKPQQSFLLVDDNAINLKILSTYVKKLSRKSSTATNGEEALNAYKKTPAAYSCIFMDISMPVMDGLEATRAIRTYEREQKRDPVLIIALTGLASSETQQEAFTSGVDLFLTKPVKLKELSSVLRSQSLLADE